MPNSVVSSNNSINELKHKSSDFFYCLACYYRNPSPLSLLHFTFASSKRTHKCKCEDQACNSENSLFLGSIGSRNFQSMISEFSRITFYSLYSVCFYFRAVHTNQSSHLFENLQWWFSRTTWISQMFTKRCWNIKSDKRKLSRGNAELSLHTFVALN